MTAIEQPIIDVVAQAMWKARVTSDYVEWSELSEQSRASYRSMAQAAIKCLRLKPE